MKTLRYVLYIIVAMFLGIFINLFSLSLILKNVVQDEVITNVIKNSIAEQYLTNNIDKLSEEDQKKIEDFLNDNASDEIINILMDNYINYQSDENYVIPQKDVDTIKNYVKAHEDLIKQVSDEDVNIDEILNEITVENIHKTVKEDIGELDDLPSGVDSVIKSYKNITVGPIKLILALIIIVCILLLMLISWSIIKWMKATGICFITNGVLIILLFIVIDGIKDLIIKSIDLGIFVDNMSFTNILIIGLTELILGIALVITHKILIKKNIKSTSDENVQKAY